MGSNGVGQTSRLLNAIETAKDFGRNLFVQFDVLVELGEDRAPQRLEFRIAFLIGCNGLDLALKVCRGVFDAVQAPPLTPFDKYLDRSIRQLEHLQDVRDTADRIKVFFGRFVLGRVFLRDQHNRLARLHGRLKGLDRFRTPHE